MEDLKVTIIQYDIIWEQKKANFSKLEADFLSKMTVGETDLIALPEMFATGFTMKPADFYESVEGPTIRWLKKWAANLNCTLIAGLITKNQENKFQNTLAVAHSNGKVETYHKRHLFRMGEENKHYVPGSIPKIIDIKGWKINVQICYDLRFPAFARNKMIDSKPAYDALIYIANWPERRTYAWTQLLKARAIENQAYVLGVNRVGDDVFGVSHSGESTILGFQGKQILLPIVNSEKAVTVVLNYEPLNQARSRFPVLLDADYFCITD